MAFSFAGAGASSLGGGPNNAQTQTGPDLEEINTEVTMKPGVPLRFPGANHIFPGFGLSSHRRRIQSATAT